MKPDRVYPEYTGVDQFGLRDDFRPEDFEDDPPDPGKGFPDVTSGDCDEGDRI